MHRVLECARGWEMQSTSSVHELFAQNNPFRDGCMAHMEGTIALRQVIKVRRAEMPEQKCAVSIEETVHSSRIGIEICAGFRSVRKLTNVRRSQKYQVTPVDTKCIGTNNGFRRWKLGLSKRRCTAYGTQQAIGSSMGKNIETFGISIGRQVSSHKLTYLQHNIVGVYPIKRKIFSHVSTENTKALHKRFGESEEWCISTIPDMMTCS